MSEVARAQETDEMILKVYTGMLFGSKAWDRVTTQFCLAHVELGQKVLPIRGQMQPPARGSAGIEECPLGALQPVIP